MQSKEEIKQLNNQDFLEARKREIRSKCENLLKELPSFVRDFYTSREGTNEDLTRFAYIKDIKEFL